MARRAVVLDTAPEGPAVSLPEAKVQLREDGTAADELIESLVAAAQAKVEELLDQQLVTATWKLLLDEFPESPEPIVLPKAPAQSVASITYVDTDGATQTLDAANYQLDGESKPARITPAHDKVWPATRLGELNAVEVTFSAGYGDPKDVPQLAKAAILLLTHHLYNHREAVVIGQGNAVFELPLGFEYLLNSVAHEA